MYKRKDRVLSDDGVPADEESYKHLAEKYKSYKSFRRHITTPKLEPVAKDEQQPHVEEKPPEKHDETEEADSKNILAKRNLFLFSAIKDVQWNYILLTVGLMTAVFL